MKSIYSVFEQNLTDVRFWGKNKINFTVAIKLEKAWRTFHVQRHFVKTPEFNQLVSLIKI